MTFLTQEEIMWGMLSDVFISDMVSNDSLDAPISMGPFATAVLLKLISTACSPKCPLTDWHLT